jgi:hypothetical protein
MPRKPPDTDAEFASLVDLTLAEVPLSPEEIAEARKDLGIDTKRLGARIGQLLEKVKDDERRADFVRAEQSMRADKVAMLAKIVPVQRTREEAKKRLRALESRAGAPAAIEGYKLDKLTDEDLNRIVAELEALLDDGSSEEK